MELHGSKIIVDTHTLIWSLGNRSRLSEKASYILLNSSIPLVVLPIVLCELLYYLRKNNMGERFPIIYRELFSDPRIEIPDLSSFLILSIPESLEMHDGLIAAHCLSEKEALILTCDQEIRAWDSELTVW